MAPARQAPAQRFDREHEGGGLFEDAVGGEAREHLPRRGHAQCLLTPPPGRCAGRAPECLSAHADCKRLQCRIMRNASVGIAPVTVRHPSPPQAIADSGKMLFLVLGS